MESSRCPAALESDDGTVQEEINTNTKQINANAAPPFLDLPLRFNHAPIGTKISGIQNQIAAISIDSMSRTAASRFMNITGNLAFSRLFPRFRQSVTTK